MKIAVEGCAHGELDVIYERIAQEEARGHFKVDLLICCGDFQSVRNASDLACMAVPQKYKEMCSFHKYYSGEKRAPILTVFIGGNHEASNYLQELPYGGWVAPGIYYMGYAGVVQFRGLRIAGLSGIYKGPDYLKGRHELPPYSNSTIRSVYHVRNLDVFRLRQLTGKIDILITHDWPRGIYNYGDKNTLLRYKEFFREEVEQNTLGSRAGELLLEDVRPAHWFAAHLHVRFTATVNHEEKDGKPASVTRFLALDKCLPKRKFLEIIDFPDGNSNKNYLDYDEEWLAILKSTNHLLSVVNSTQHMPGPGYSGRWDFRPTKEELAKVKSAFNPDLRIPENFIRTAPVFNGRHRFDGVVPDPLKNPQTESFCDKLGVDDPVEVILSSRAPAKKRVDVSVVEESELDVTLSGTNEKTDISISTDSEDTGSPGLFFVDKQGSTPSSTLNSTPRLPSFSRSTPNFNRSGNAFSPSSPFQSPPLTQRFRMTLPSPKQDKQEEAMVSRGTLGPKIYPSSPLAIRYPAESPKRECNSDVGPRQFKRRNASLYDASE